MANKLLSWLPFRAKGPRPEMREVATAPVWDKFSTYPSNGLTPATLAQIFREADAGDVMRQMELFEEMEEKDTHLFSQLQTRKNAVTGLDFEILPFDAEDERDKAIAEFVAAQIGGLECFEDACMDLLDAIGKGVAVSEIMWGYEDGHTIVTDIRTRYQKRFFWDQDDNFKVVTRDEPQGIMLPQNKFIVHRYKARSGHAARAGVLRVCAWMYLFKNYTIKDWVAFCEVYGMPLRLGKYSPGSSDADKAALMDALMRIGTDAAGMVPEGTMIEFIESNKTTSADIYERLARYCDEQMSKAVLGQTLTSDSGGGSYAQSTTHNEVRHDLTVADCKALAATLRRDLIRPLVLFNFGEDKRIPQIRYDCEEAADLKETAEIYSVLASQVGITIPTGHIYKKFGIPKPEAGDEVTKSLTPAPFKLLPNRQPLNRAKQQEIDTLADASVQAADAAFSKMYGPIANLVDKSSSLEELMALLENKEAVQELALKMEIADLEQLLQRAMFLADLEGRAVENDA